MHPARQFARNLRQHHELRGGHGAGEAANDPYKPADDLQSGAANRVLSTAECANHNNNDHDDHASAARQSEANQRAK
jgi:hypothetical protein